MSYNEKQFLHILKSIDASTFRIKQISNYAIYYREHNYDNILNAWKKTFFYSSTEIKQLLIYAANDIICQTHKKGKCEYIKGFGDFFMEYFPELIKQFNNLENLNTLIGLCNLWEDELIYANNFMELLRNIIRNRIANLSNDPLNIIDADNDQSLSNDLNLILKHDFCRKGLILDIEEYNIQNKNEGIDKDKINKILVYVNDPDDSNFKDINETEDRLQEFRKILIMDTINRENYILNLANFIENEKETYFSLEDIKNNK